MNECNFKRFLNSSDIEPGIELTETGSEEQLMGNDDLAEQNYLFPVRSNQGK